MDDQERFDRFMQRVLQRPLPQNPMARVRLLARELAEGAVEGIWNAGISHYRGTVNDRPAVAYRLKRWDGIEPDAVGDFGQQIRYPSSAPDLSSYRRKDSSAFALLLLARLKAEGLEPFLDLALVPGEDWRAGLKKRLQSYDHFIVLIGQATLTSDVVVEEIGWALEGGLTIIPVWHNGFRYRPEEWPALPPAIDEVLRTRHTIRVVEENPLYYNSAVVELLNRFGVTP